MEYCDNLVESRKGFIEQLSNLVNSQFDGQNTLSENLKETEKIIENNPEFIQKIFIDAPWGMGKTYFGQALKEKLEKEEENKVEIINIWEIDYFSDPMKSFMGELRDKKILEKGIKDKAEELLSLNKSSIIKKSFPFLLDNVLFPFLEKYTGVKIEGLKGKVENIVKGFSEINLPELEEYKKYKKAVEEFKEELNKDDKRKVIIIDELDRCRPDYAISILEIIKHFFGVKNIIFVFLVNKEQLKNTVLNLYLKEDKNEEYFEKFFDIEFKLPEIRYNEYIKIEYKKYYDINSYEIDNTNTSNRKDLLFDKNFLDILKFYNKNDENWERKISLRSFIKTFKKFKVLINSLSEEERAHYPLVLCLIIYFYCKEFEVKSKNDPDNNIGKYLYLTILYELFNKKTMILQLYKILNNESNKKTIIIDNFFEKREQVNVGIDSTRDIKFKDLYYNISYYERDINVLRIPTSIISEGHGNNSDIIWEWCEKKYNFIKNIN
ncbi:P-loop NTPase fold protein [uncultured Fusobacterium sp.]|uniref:KAP family P-loop NTPase fold protein n=1 Tax=uncultured Fusobacterium sp. TaxID=159267 RepID=UPI0015A70025|nr:P-loop NTPase fold protein [uncultured Fusobacterium sp.]